MSELSLVTRAPRVHLTLVIHSHRVAMLLTSTTRHTNHFYAFKPLNRFWGWLAVFVPVSKLEALTLTPRVDLSVLGHTSSVSKSCSHIDNYTLNLQHFWRIQIVLQLMPMESLDPYRIQASVLFNKESKSIPTGCILA